MTTLEAMIGRRHSYGAVPDWTVRCSITALFAELPACRSSPVRRRATGRALAAADAAAISLTRDVDIVSEARRSGWTCRHSVSEARCCRCRAQAQAQCSCFSGHLIRHTAVTARYTTVTVALTRRPPASARAVSFLSCAPARESAHRRAAARTIRCARFGSRSCGHCCSLSATRCRQ